MKKLLIGLGVLLLVGGAVLGFWMVKTFGGAIQAAQQQQAQQQELARLNASYPYTPPGAGEVQALSEERLNDYLTVRESALPLVQQLGYKTVELQHESARKKKSSPGLATTLEAGGMLIDIASKAHATYLESLKQHRMSPNEFRGLTQLIYGLHAESLKGELQRFRLAEQKNVEQGLAALRARMKDDTLTAEKRAALEMQETQYLAWLKRLEEPAPEALSEEAQAAREANLALVKKHRLRIAKATDPDFDRFIENGTSVMPPITAREAP
jgi:hypothetical protein